MSQKIIKIGSSYGVTLNASVLKAAGLQHGDHVRVEVNEKDSIIEVRSTERDEFNRTVAAAMQLVAKHRDELSKVDGE